MISSKTVIKHINIYVKIQLIYSHYATGEIHVRLVIPTWDLRLSLTPLNASIIKPCCFLAMEDPSVSGWLRAQRGGGYERAGGGMRGRGGWMACRGSVCPDGSLCQQESGQEGEAP